MLNLFCVLAVAEDEALRVFPVQELCDLPRSQGPVLWLVLSWKQVRAFLKQKRNNNIKNMYLLKAEKIGTK